MFKRLVILVLAAYPLTSSAVLSESEISKIRQALFSVLAEPEFQSVRGRGGESASQQKTDAANAILNELKSFGAPTCQPPNNAKVDLWSAATGADLAKNGFSVGWDPPKSVECNENMCIARAAVREVLEVPKDLGVDLEVVLNAYTSDLRSAADRDLDLGVIMPHVYRHFWSAENGVSQKLLATDTPKPMDPNKSYVVKKCLNAKSDWICNNQHYRIVKLSDKSYAVLSLQASSDQFPDSYTEGGANTRFSQDQSENFFAGFTAVTVISDVGDQIEIYDTNHFNTETKERTDGLKKAMNYNVIKTLVSHDLALLKRRIPSAVNPCGAKTRSTSSDISNGTSTGTK